MDDIDNLFEDNYSRTSIAAAISYALNENSDFEGGTILKMAEYFETLIDMEETDDDSVDVFVETTIGSLSILIGSTLGWTEISSVEARHVAATAYLKTLDTAALQWADDQNNCYVHKEFQHSNIRAFVGKYIGDEEENDDICVTVTDDDDSICLSKKLSQEVPRIKQSILFHLLLFLL